jgi:glycosyltransferase involved in cell wall biosynthesis
LKLAIISTHPIQYYAPLFRQLSQEPGIELKVYYTWSQSREGSTYDTDFAKVIEWDIPLLEGYSYEFVENHAGDPGLHHFKGIDNPGLIQAIKGWKPDALLVIGWNYKSHLRAMRFFKGKTPILFKGDSTLLDERPGVKKILRRIFLTWVYRHVDYALYAGKENLAYFQAHGLKDQQLEFVPHAIDNKRFGNDSQNTDEEVKKWKARLGIAPSDLVILFAGKLEPKKDPEFMLRMASGVPSEQIKFIIAGNGKLQYQLRAMAQLDKRIIFLDFQNQRQMPQVYRLGDIFVLPSKGPGETWGLAINEAMACGLPVIASDRVGGGWDLIEEDKTGWIFKPGNEGEAKIISLLERLGRDKQTLKKMGEAAKQKVQSYSYPVAITKIKKILAGLPGK